jgi:hypothetical protein
MREGVRPAAATASRPARALLAASLAAAAFLLIAHFGKGQNFFLNEWELVLQRRGWDAETLLAPLNEHLFLVPITVFKVLLELVGLGPHWVFQVPVVAAHLATALLLFLLARVRVGEWLALGAAVIVLFLGSAWDDLLMPIQVSFVGSMAAGLAMLLVFDRPASRSRDIACAFLLTASLACSGIGLSFAAVAFVEVVGRPGWRRLWIVGLPMLLWLLWFAVYGTTELEAGGNARANLPFLPSFVADEVAAALGAVAGLSLEWGRVLALPALALVVRALLSGSAMSVRLLSLLAGVLSFWTLTGLARAHLNDPGATRYLYVSGVFAILIAAELARDRAPASRLGSALLVAAVLFCVLGNLNHLRGGRDTFRDWSEETSARLAALELAGPASVGPDFRPAPSLAPRLYAADYFNAVRAFGSAAAPRDALVAASERARRGADDTLTRALALRPREAIGDDGSPRVSVDAVRGGRLVTRPPCAVVLPRAPLASIEVTAPPAGVIVRADGDEAVTVSVRRFADAFGPAVGTVAPGEARVVRTPALGSTVPWHVRAASETGVAICRTAP